MAKKGHQRMYFLRCLRKAQLPQQLLINFYRRSIESIITYCITAWYPGCTADNRKALQRISTTAQRIMGAQLTPLEEIHRSRCSKKALSICKDPTHPGHGLFTLLPSGSATEHSMLHQ